MGYPQLDVKQWADGEWAIREFIRSPVIPSLTPWKYVLTGMRNIEITRGFIEKYLWQIDPRNKGFWEKDESEREREEKERQYFENEKAERIMQLGKQLSKNEDLMEEAYKKGPAAFDLENIGRKIYRERPWKLKDL
jgi:hypothetical protein